VRQDQSAFFRTVADFKIGRLDDVRPGKRLCGAVEETDGVFGDRKLGDLRDPKGLLVLHYDRRRGNGGGLQCRFAGIKKVNLLTGWESLAFLKGRNRIEMSRIENEGVSSVKKRKESMP
jgi:hypothetical protein